MILIKLAFRRLLKDKKYTLINLLGLSVGLCAFMTLDIHTHFEQSYDRFYKDVERIYRINTHWIQEGRSQEERAGAVPPLAWRLPQSLPEIEEITRLHNTEPKRQIVSYSPTGGNRIIDEENHVYYADSNFFKVFDIPFVAGSPDNALAQPYTAIISERGRAQYFGQENPIGKELLVNGERPITYTITGVFEDIPGNSHLPDTDLLLSLSTKLAEHPEWNIPNHWFWQRFFTYVKLKEGVDIEGFTEKFNMTMADINQEIYAPRSHEMKAQLVPVLDVHATSKVEDEFKPGGNGEVTQMLYWLGWLIVTVALTNYINMTTAKSVERAREIGIRKVFGSHKRQLIFQLLTESFVMGLAVIGVSLLLLQVALPYFNSLTDQQLTIRSLTTIQWSISLLTFLAITTLSNLYPAMVMTGFKPSSILRGSYSTSNKGVVVRKSLVVAQYMISIVIVLMTFAAYQQMDSLLHRELGFKSEQQLVIKGPRTKTQRYSSQYDYFKNQVIAQTGVSSFSASTFIPGYETVGFRSLKSRHMDQSAITRFHRVDYDIINTMGFELLAGRDFDPARPADRSGVIITSSSLSVFGFESPAAAIGERLAWSNNIDEDIDSPIIAVIDDYQQNIKSNEKVPKVFAFLRGYESPWSDEYYILNLNEVNNTEQVSATLDFISALWQEQFPDDPYYYFFLDDHFNRVIASEITTTKLMATFGAIALFIANLGLLGIIIFTINQRMREISIRKVLGAPILVIARLINQESLLLVAIASVIAIPCAVIIIAQWMNDYEVQAELPAWAYFVPTLIIILLGAMVSAHQTIRAAMVNPIRFLRNE